MKEIKKYIQFAIDNGLNIKLEKGVVQIKKVLCNFEKIVSLYGDGYSCIQYDYIRLITSKPFIEAIAYGNWKNTKAVNHYYKKNGSYPPVQGPDFLSTNNKITFGQAIAIRDNKLEEFINNLLKGTKN